MAIIKSGATSDLLTVDATSKAARVSTYDALGNYHGVKATYRASTASAQNGVVIAAASAVNFFVLYGSGSKTVTVQRIYVSGGTATAVAYAAYILSKYSSQPSAGTPVVLTQTPMDTNFASPTAALCQVYTAAPTAGTLVGTISAKRTLLQATTAAAAGVPDVVEFDFRTIEENSGIILRGVNQGIGLNFGAAPATAVTLALTVEWTEE